MLEYRSGAETDLDNVLQIHSVFLSVSKGQTAPSQELEKSFGPKKPLDEIIMEILQKGEMQVGEKERHAQLERIHTEVMDIVAGKLVDPASKRVYTTGMIEKALDQLSSQGSQKHVDGGKGSTDIVSKGEEEVDGGKGKGRELPTWTGVVTNKSAKSQALEAMKALIAWQPIPVSRARMRLRITCPAGILKQAAKGVPRKDGVEEVDRDDSMEKATGTVKDRILSYVEQIESQDTMGQDWELVGFVEPGAFKGLGGFIRDETKGRGRVEVLDMAIVHEGD